MMMKRGLLAISVGTLLGGAIYLPLRLYAASEPASGHVLPPAESGGVVVGLCDGETSIEVPWLKPGQRLNEQQARAVSNALMANGGSGIRTPNGRWRKRRRAGPAHSRVTLGHLRRPLLSRAVSTKG